MGRNREYASDADRQRAYRARKAELLRARDKRIAELTREVRTLKGRKLRPRRG